MASDLAVLELGKLPSSNWIPKVEECDVLGHLNTIPFKKLPFTQYRKNEKLAGICNFYSQKWKDENRGVDDDGEMWDDDDFKYVYDPDKVGPQHKRRNFRRERRKRYVVQGKKFERAFANSTKVTRLYGENTKAKRNKKNRNWLRKKKSDRKFGNNNWGWKKLKEPSVGLKDHWRLVKDFNLLEELCKERHPKLREGATLTTVGTLHEINPKWEKSHKIVPLTPCNGKTRVDPRTCQDPIMQRYMNSGAGNIFITDTIAALIMTCWRSQYSWDVMIDKEGDRLVFDKRQKSNISIYTVDENAQGNAAPTHGEDRRPSKDQFGELARECTQANVAFSEQLISGRGKVACKERNIPFSTSDATKAKSRVAYLYRQFQYDEGTVVCRCEVNGYQGTKNDLVLTRCVLQYNPQSSQAQDWKKTIGTKYRTIMLGAIRQNRSMVARWTAQAILAGAKKVKLGFVARNRITSNTSHSLCTTRSFTDKEMANEVNGGNGRDMPRNMWGMFFAIVKTVRAEEDGRFILVKDPNQPRLRIYRIYDNEFDNEGEKDASESEGEE